jgi:hypothetical protein
MKKLFAYNRQEDEAFNSLVDCALDLARASFEGKRASDYDEKNKALLEGFAKRGVQGTSYADAYEAKGLAAYHSSMLHNNQNVRDNFNAVISQVITALVPEVVNNDFQNYIAEIHQVGYGDTARFIIESNDLFKVNAKAEGIRRGVDQPMYDNEYTVHAHPITISTHIDWYPFAAGVFDMGNFMLKIARSFEAYIFLKAIKGMTQASTKFGAAFTTNGVTPQLWGTLKQRVSAANGGMNVIAIGTEIALSNCSLAGNYQVQIGEEMNKVGYLDQYLSTPLIALKNVLVPGTTNGAATLAIADDVIYMIPVGGQRPVKIVFEGNEVSVAFNPAESSDLRMGIDVTLRVGIGVICGPKFGTIEL